MYQDTGTGATSSFSFTTSATTEYIRISLNISSLESTKLETGPYVTSFESYVKPNLFVLDENNEYVEFSDDTPVAPSVGDIPEVAVSATEPTGNNRRAFWYQKGKALCPIHFELGAYYTLNAPSETCAFTNYVVKKGVTYTITTDMSGDVAYTRRMILTQEKTPSIKYYKKELTSFYSQYFSGSHTFTPEQDGYITVMLYKAGVTGGDSNFYVPWDLVNEAEITIINNTWKFTLVEGSEAIIEDYIEPKLYMLNEYNEYVEVDGRGYKSITFRGTKTLDSQLLEKGDTIQGYKNINELTFVANSHVYGGVQDTGFNFKRDNTTVGRATSLYQCLYGDFDGMKVVLKNPTLSTGVGVSYALWYGYLVDNSIKGSQYVSSSPEFTIDRWLTEDITLPINENNTNQRVLFISFKRGDGTSDFTDEELEELKTCIEIPGVTITFDYSEGRDPSAILNTGSNMIGVDDISKIKLEAGYGLSGGADNSFNIGTASKFKATSLTNALYGNLDGKTISFVKPTLSSGKEVSYAVWYGYVISNVFKPTQCVSNENKFVSLEWIKEDITLPTDTANQNKRVMFVYFKCDDDTEELTAEDIEELKTCINIT